jgi:hypothetical protein
VSTGCSVAVLQIDNDAPANPVLLCANATRIHTHEVLITNWTVVGSTVTIPDNNTINEAYLNQFVGVFSFTVYGESA